MPLEISLRAALPNGSLGDETGDLVVVALWSFSLGKKGNYPPVLQALDSALGGGLATVLGKDEFTGKKDQSVSVTTFGRMGAARVVVLGLGDRAAARDADLRTFGAKAARMALGEKAKRLLVSVPDGAETRVRALVEGLELGAYRFSKYLTGDRKPKDTLSHVSIVTARKAPPTAKKDIPLGQQIAAGVNLSRDLSNEPPNKMTPAALAQAAVDLAKASGMKATVFDYKEIVKRGMSLIDAVGRGSENEPRLVHVAYVPAKKPKKTLVFVGKGVTFDTGGISIKPAAGMQEMKHDMSGAANVIGLMAAVAALKPQVAVHGIFAAAENMPDGNAYRPGDIWGSLDGKSVEIVNTDAEGRLILADALAYARELAPDLLVDNATLTGACVVALGTTCSGYYANSDAANAEFAGALKASGEQMWRMPLLEDLKDQLKSDVADIKHTGDRWGGSITAALFLREFIGTTKNWVHVDVAGPASTERVYGWNPKGATGHAVLTFLALVERAQARA
jgi:leucyl aminopeptidase